jgi:hypothetical protein
MDEFDYAEATAVSVVGPYVVLVTFADGTRRRIDLEGQLWGEVFEPLKNPAYFAQVFIDPEFGVLTWPNGADLAPEFTYAAGELVAP